MKERKEEGEVSIRIVKPNDSIFFGLRFAFFLVSELDLASHGRTSLLSQVLSLCYIELLIKVIRSTVRRDQGTTRKRR